MMPDIKQKSSQRVKKNDVAALELKSDYKQSRGSLIPSDYAHIINSENRK